MKYPIKGSGNCERHQGGPTSRAKVAMRALAMEVDATLGFEPADDADADIDLPQHVLKAIGKSARREEAYGAEIRRLIAEKPSLEAALIGDVLSADMDGELRKTGEYIRGIQRLEDAERERGMAWSFKALAIGIEARRVEQAAAQGSQIAEVLAAVRAHPSLGLDDRQRAAFGAVIREVLGLTVAGPALREIEEDHE